jgi:hypothetical protein
MLQPRGGDLVRFEERPMKLVKQAVVGLMLVLLGVVIGLSSVPYLASQAAFPPQPNLPNGGQALAVPAGGGPRVVPVDMRQADAHMQIGAQLSDPKFAVSSLGRIGGHPIVELPELLNVPLVQALLQLSEKQKEEIAKLNGSDGLVRELDRRDLEQRGVEGARSQESAIAHENRSKEREAVLEAKQLGLARRILCQLNQEYSLADLQVAGELAVTAAQKAEMQQVVRAGLPAATPAEKKAFGLLAQQASHTRLLSRLGSEAARAAALRLEGVDQAEQVVRERNRKLAEEFPAVCQKLREVLTPEQQRQWDAMQGVRMEAWELDEVRGGLGESRLVTQP